MAGEHRALRADAERKRGAYAIARALPHVDEGPADAGGPRVA